MNLSVSRLKVTALRAKFTLLLFSISYLCLPTTVMAENAHDRGIGLYLDQDLFAFGLNEDRDYTTGVAMEFFWQKEGIYPLDKAVLWFGNKFGILDENTKTERSFLIGNIAFTPDNLSASAPIQNDRPYASLIYLANKHVYADHDAAIGIVMQAGILGTSISREVQQVLHRQWRNATDDTEPVDPKGWGHQISNGGELTFGLGVAYSKLLAESDNRTWDIAATSNINVGYETHAGLGLSARVGNIASPFWTLPYNPIRRGNFLPSLAGEEWYLWAAYRARVIGYNALLQGQFRDSDVEFDGDELRRLVHDAGVGLTLTYKPAQVTFSVNAKSAELDVGAADRLHVWGGMYVTFRF